MIALEESAAAFGRTKGLERPDGSWSCWSCGSEQPFHLSLHCHPCRSRAKRYPRPRHVVSWDCYAGHSEPTNDR